MEPKILFRVHKGQFPYIVSYQTVFFFMARSCLAPRPNPTLVSLIHYEEN